MSNAVPWWANSLLSTLLAILVAGIAVSFDRRKTVNQELIRKRIAVYDQMAPMLNELFCFFRSVGAWKALTPPGMIEHKRSLDHLFHVYVALFSKQFSNDYYSFVETMFASFQEWGQPPKLKGSLVVFKSERGADWDTEWDRLFLADAHTDHYEIGRRYDALMDQFAIEIGARRSWRPKWLIGGNRRGA